MVGEIILIITVIAGEYVIGWFIIKCLQKRVGNIPKKQSSDSLDTLKSSDYEDIRLLDTDDLEKMF